MASGNIQKVATTLSGLQKSGGLAGVALKGAGLAIAGGLAVATKGAVEAQNAQAGFIAATGKSKDEAKAFVSGMDSLAGSAGAVGVSFDKIAETGTMVEQQFGTTGKATTDLTEQILEFAKVTKTDSTEAAANLDDTLAALNLTSADAGPLMDKLVVAQQNFGVSIKDGLPALQAMAPALDAMGASGDDGVAMLAALEQGGIHAGDAASALNKAIKGLKPGQDLGDLITQVSSIEDPTLRAQKAVELFGKSGAKMAQVFQPGIDSLDSFKASAEDLQGATHDTAAAMETDQQKIQGFFDQALAGAREVGNQFGPAITGLASLGTLSAPLIKGLGGVLATVANDTGLLGAARAIGLKWSSGIGLGLGIGLPLVVLPIIQDFIEKNAPKDSAFNPNSTGPVPGYQALLKFAANKGKEAGAAGAEAQATEWSTTLLDEFQSHAMWDPIGQAAGDTFAHDSVKPFQGAATVAVTTFGNAFDHDSRSVLVPGSAAAAKQVASAFADSEAWKNSARAIGSNLADALRGSKNAVSGAMDDLTYAIDHPLKLEKESARIQAYLTGSELQKGLNSKSDTIRTQAEQTRAFLIHQWELLNGRAYTTASDTSSDVESGLRSHYSEAVQDAWDFATKVNAALNRIHNDVNVNVDYTRSGQQSGRALGGPVAPNTMYEVAEGGIPEMLAVGPRTYLLMGSKAGRVIPIDQSSSGGSLFGTRSGGGGEVHLHLHLDSVVPPSGSQMAAAARAFVPELTREMRRQRLLPAT